MGPAKAKVVVLCGGAPRHVYVANRLCRSLDVLAIVQEIGRRVTAAKLVSLAKPQVAARKIGRWLRDRKRYAGNREAEFFFRQSEVSLDRRDLVQRAEYINDAAVFDTVRRLAPDVVAVFGTSLIRPPLLGQGRLADKTELGENRRHAHQNNHFKHFITLTWPEWSLNSTPTFPPSSGKYKFPKPPFSRLHYPPARRTCARPAEKSRILFPAPFSRPNHIRSVSRAWF